MRIGELASRVGISTDAVRFYEREGLLRRPARRENGYREYGDADVEHLRLLIDLRSLEIPLAQAAQAATMCHSGHCADTSRALPSLIVRQREEIAQRVARLQLLDSRLADLGRHLTTTDELRLVRVGACCDAAAAILTAGEGSCACCSPQASASGDGDPSGRRASTAQ
jgi:DNA-binding transcriptional MerR regulator